MTFTVTFTLSVNDSVIYLDMFTPLHQQCMTFIRFVNDLKIFTDWPSLIRVFAVLLKKAMILSYPLSAQRRLCSDWADAQADLSLRWAYMPFCWFCHDAAHRFISQSLGKANVVVVVVLVFYGPSTLFRSFRARSVNISTLVLGKPLGKQNFEVIPRTGRKYKPTNI